MALAAFKSKYTGEQIDKLLDLLSSGSLLEPQAGENQYYSTEESGVFHSENGTKYAEFKRGIMTFRIESNYIYSGRVMPINGLLKETTNSEYSLYMQDDNNCAYYTFDVPIIPKQLRVKTGSKMNFDVYYLINDTYELQKTYTATEAGYTLTLPLPSIETSKIKIKLGHYANLYHLILDFVTDEYVTGMSIKDGTL